MGTGSHDSGRVAEVAVYRSSRPPVRARERTVARRRANRRQTRSVLLKRAEANYSASLLRARRLRHLLCAAHQFRGQTQQGRADQRRHGYVGGRCCVHARKLWPSELFRARIGNNLNFSGGNFVAGAAEAAVSLVDANIAGDVLFLEGFKTDGFVDMRLAKVGDSVTFKNVQFVGGGDNGLNAERVAIEGTLYWFSVAVTARTVLDLENASAGALWDDSSSWPAKGNLVIDGFAYNDFSGGPSDAAGRLKWLALQPVGYHPRPYRRVAKVLRDDGREAEANTVEIAKEVEHRRFGEMSLLERAWNLLLQATIGYGFRPLRALWWIIGFVLLGTALFAWGYSAKVMTPTDETAYREFMKSGLTPPHYPPFNPLVYSLENFLPVVDLYQGSYWRPNPRDLPGGELHMGSLTSDARTFPGAMLRGYLWIHILAGWILTPLLFAGLSGLVRIE